MKIRNESKRVYNFNGGSIAPGRTIEVGDAKIAKALIANYPGDLVCLDTIKVDAVIEAEKVPEKKLTKAKKDSKN